MSPRNRSVTEGSAALDLFTDRHSLILDFTRALSQDPPPEKAFFFGGGGGNGKSLLLWFLEKHCCKRFSDWEANIQHLGPEKRMARLVETTETESEEVQFESVPAVFHDFAAPLSEFEQPKVAYDALMMLRRDLSALGFQFPLYSFASVWYLKQQNMLTERRLQSIIPDEEAGLISVIVDAISGTSWGSVASAVLKVFDEHLQERWTLWKTRWGVDESTVSEIMQMDPKRELHSELPRYFAHDLNAAMEGEGAAERLVLFFDHYESFFRQDTPAQSGSPGRSDGWLAYLLETLDQSTGILPVLAGREAPQWNEPPERYRVPIRRFSVDHFTDRDADHFLQKAGVEDRALRERLMQLARVNPEEVHPLFVGLGADIVRAAARQDHTLTADDLSSHETVEGKRQVLVNHLLRWADEESGVEDAVKVLGAARAIDRSLYFHLADRLHLESTGAAFTTLCNFSFVWQDERGSGWYRIHDLLRRILREQEEDRTRRAHEALEEIYRKRAEEGAPLAESEAIYHRYHQDETAGVQEWREVFSEGIDQSRFDLCEALLDVRGEFTLTNTDLRGAVTHQEGRYYLRLARYDEAQEAYQEAINAHEETLQHAPDDVSAHNNKGLSLQGRADVLAEQGEYESALDAYHEAIGTYEEALDHAPDHINSHMNKNTALVGRADVLAWQSNYEQALETYQKAIGAYEEALQRAPDHVSTHMSKGIALKGRADVLAEQGEYESALDAYQEAIDSFEEALRRAPGNVSAHGNKDATLIGRADVLARQGKHERALEACQKAIDSCEETLRHVPGDARTHMRKGTVLRQRADMLAEQGEYESALDAYHKAIDAYEEALQHAPNHPRVLYNKARALLNLGQLLRRDLRMAPAFVERPLRNAKRLYDRVLQIAPRHTRAREKAKEVSKWIEKI